MTETDWDAPTTLTIRRGDLAAVAQALGHANNISEEAKRAKEVFRAALDTPAQGSGGADKLFLYRCPHHGLIDGAHYREGEWVSEEGCPLLCADEETCGQAVERVLLSGQGMGEEDRERLSGEDRARLELIRDHDGNDLSENDKALLTRLIDAPAPQSLDEWRDQLVEKMRAEGMTQEGINEALAAMLGANDPPHGSSEGERGPCLAVTHDQIDCSHLSPERRCRNCQPQQGGKDS